MKRSHLTERNCSFFSTLSKNYEVLVALTDGAMSKQLLARELDVSTKTIYRRTKELETYGLVDRDSDGYRLTPVGSVHIDALFDWERGRETIDAVFSSNASLSPGTVPPYWIFGASSAVTPTDLAPDHARHRLADLVQESNALIGVVPSLPVDLIESALERATGETFDLELRLESAFVERLETARPSIGDRLEAAAVGTVDDLISFGTLISHGDGPTAIVTFHDERGVLESFLRSTDSHVVSWVMSVLAEYSTDAPRWSR